MHNLSKVGLGIAGALVAREIYGFVVVQVRKHQDINELLNNVEMLQEHFRAVVDANATLLETNSQLQTQINELEKQVNDLEEDVDDLEHAVVTK